MDPTEAQSVSRQLAENLARVRETIAAACARAGRVPQDVRLVAVTKYVGPGIIRGLLELGVADLGENRVQQIDRRADDLGASDAELDAVAAGPPPRWHMIGHLQRNKVRALLRHVRIIHSLDSVRLIREVERHAARVGRLVEALIELNIAGEATKSGAPPEEIDALAEAIRGAAHIRWRGLMTMAPFVPDPQAVRPTFVRLREILDDLRDRGLAGPECGHLSMGMTNDYPVAVEEGATLVRIGSALFEGIPRERLMAP